MRLVLLLACFAAFAGEGWKSLGPFGGPAGLISVDRNNPERLIASSRNGNVFLSDNGGRNWRRLAFPYAPGSSIEALRIHPVDSNLFLAAVADETGDYSGVYESRDGGDTWKVAKELEGQGAFALAFFLKDPSIIAAGTRRGVFLSKDSGRSWRHLHQAGEAGPTPVVSVAFDPQDAEIIYAGTTHLPWKTSDGGATWKSIHAGMLDDSDVFSIHVDSKSPERVYASACSGIYASETRGEEWRKAQGIPGTDRRTHIVTEDPVYSRLIYAGTTAGLWKSADAGQTWRKLNSHLIRSVEFHPADGRMMYLATQDRGLLKSLTAGIESDEINDGFVGRPVQRLAFAGETTAATVLRTNGTPGVYLSGDFGRTWKMDEASGDVTGFRNLLFLKSSGSVRMREGGKWNAVSIPGNPEIKFLEAGGNLWAASSNAIYRSPDGRRWLRATLPAKSVLLEIFPGAKSVAVRTADALWLSVDDARTWSRLPSPAGGRLFQLALHPQNTNIILGATASGLMRSEDRGKNWRQVDTGLHPGFMYSIAADPAHPAAWYLSQMGKVFRSEDDGETWSLLPGEIDTALIRHLYVPAGNRGVFAVTSGQGIFVRQNLPIIRALGGGTYTQ